MTDYIKNSRRVIVILSSEGLQTDYCDLSVNVAIANNVPLIFIKPPHAQLAEESQAVDEILAENLDCSAAVAVSVHDMYSIFSNFNFLNIAFTVFIQIKCRKL